MSGGDVGSERHFHALFQELPYRRNAAGEVAVGHRAMHHIHAVFLHQFQFLAVGVAAVCHQGRRLTKQAVTVIRIAVAGRFGFQFGYPCNLRAVLAQVRLYRHIVLGGILTENRQHLRRARRDKPRRHNRFHKTVITMIFQVLAQHLEAFNHIFGIVLQVVGAVSVHANQSHIRTHARLHKQVRENTGRFGMHGAKHGTTHRALHP